MTWLLHTEESCYVWAISHLKYSYLTWPLHTWPYFCICDKPVTNNQYKPECIGSLRVPIWFGLCLHTWPYFCICDKTDKTCNCTRMRRLSNDQYKTMMKVNCTTRFPPVPSAKSPISSLYFIKWTPYSMKRALYPRPHNKGTGRPHFLLCHLQRDLYPPYIPSKEPYVLSKGSSKTLGHMGRDTAHPHFLLFRLQRALHFLSIPFKEPSIWSKGPYIHALLIECMIRVHCITAFYLLKPYNFSIFH